MIQDGYMFVRDEKLSLHEIHRNRFSSIDLFCGGWKLFLFAVLDPATTCDIHWNHVQNYGTRLYCVVKNYAIEFGWIAQNFMRNSGFSSKLSKFPQLILICSIPSFGYVSQKKRSVLKAESHTWFSFKVSYYLWKVFKRNWIHSLVSEPVYHLEQDSPSD